jgi:DNA-binding transcriptional MerR regulator
MEGLTRGQLAQRAEINLETVRFYEQEGCLLRRREPYPDIGNSRKSRSIAWHL